MGRREASREASCQPPDIPTPHQLPPQTETLKTTGVRTPPSSLSSLYLPPCISHRSFHSFRSYLLCSCEERWKRSKQKNCEHELLGNWCDRLVHANSYLFLRCFLYNSIIIIVFIIKSTNLPPLLLSSNFFFFLGAMLILSLSLYLDAFYLILYLFHSVFHVRKKTWT